MVSNEIITIVYSIIALIHLLFSILMLSALRVTKNIPFSSKFLSTGLILIDVGLLTTTAVNRLLKQPVVSIQISTMSTLFSQLAYTTMTLMAIERMLVIKWPMQYIRMVSGRKIKRVTCAVWTCVALMLLLIRYLLCWAKTPATLAVFYDYRECASFVMLYHLGFLTFGQIISTVSYIVVLKIVRKQMLRDYMIGSCKSFKQILRMYKSTGMVFIYIIVMTVTSLVFYITIALYRATLISDEATGIIFQSANIFNCVLDPFLYVLWYTECRLACRKLIRNMCCRFSDNNVNNVSAKNTNTVFQIKSTGPSETIP